MRILYVGFKGKNNTSFQLVSVLHGEHLFLTNSFMGLKRDIDAIDNVYDEVVMFGTDRSLSTSIRIEMAAEHRGEVLETKLSAQSIAAKFQNHAIESSISSSPTHYLCNEAYFRMLEKTDRNAIFIHIPGIKHMTDEMMEKLIKSLGE